MTLTFYCNYSSIARYLIQGATEVTISRVKMTLIFYSDIIECAARRPTMSVCSLMSYSRNTVFEKASMVIL